MDKQLVSNREMWDEWTGINARSKFYRLEEFKQGLNVLDPLVREEVGNVAGKTLLHLQCHFGMDTLSWARLGANVTGVDFSPEAVKLAGSLSRELNIPARFVCSNIYDLKENLEETFDIVFASYGVLTWLPDVDRWMQIAASYLKPGGFLYIMEGHPIMWVFDENSDHWQPFYPYFQKDVFTGEITSSYSDPDVITPPRTCYEWQHTLGDVVTAACKSGLRLEFLHEFGQGFFQALPSMQKGADGFWHHPQGDDRLPLAFSIKARRE